MPHPTFLGDLSYFHLYTILIVFLLLLIIDACEGFKSYWKALKSTFSFNELCQKDECVGFFATHCSIITLLLFLFYFFSYDSVFSEISDVAFCILDIYFIATLIPLLSVLVRRYRTIAEKAIERKNSITESRSNCHKRIKTNNPATKHFCFECGAENPLEAKYCSDCGNRLSENSNSEKT